MSAIPLATGRMVVPYSDNSGDRLSVEFAGNKSGVDVVKINGFGEVVLNRDDVPWMIAALQTAWSHIALPIEEPSA